MISLLKYDIGFSNGKGLSQELTLENGSTLITGKNGKGKSMTFEMIAFAFFGAKALRGAAADYKKISCDMTVTIKEVTYEINRTKSNAKVILKGETIVSGNTPVNQWVTRTLGQDYNVFRIAHWCAQGDIQALANMRPTERKAMIDSVAGLTQMDGLSKELNNEWKTLSAEVNAVKGTLVQPQKPECSVEGDVTKWEKSLAGTEALLTKFNEAQSVQKPSEPFAPTEPSEPIYADEPKKLGNQSVKKPEPLEIKQGMPSTVQQAIAIENQFLDQLQILEPMERKLLDLEAKRNPDVKFPKGFETVEKLEAAWNEYNLHLKIETLKDQSGVDCPHCKEHFFLNTEIAELEKGKTRKTEPSITRSKWAELKTQLEINAEHDKVEAEFDAERMDNVRTALSQIRKARADLELFEDEMATYTKQENLLLSLHAEQLDSWKKQIASQKTKYNAQFSAYQTQLTNYKAALVKYDEGVAAYETAQKYISGLLVTTSNYKEELVSYKQNCQSNIAELKLHADRWTRYESDLKEYNAQLSGISEKETELSELANAQAALKSVKSQVQNHLIPSLNVVASKLMFDMTGGEFQEVEIGQDFEVNVDGQSLRTLSGSGKDLANLTLRIALGRILTHKTLPVVMLDEIDSAMDDTRAGYTWDCINRITPQIGQVIQASHKELDASRRIEV